MRSKILLTYFLLLIAITNLASQFVDALDCYKCLSPTSKCRDDADTCVGDYCLSSRFEHPTLGKQQMVTAMGCVRSSFEPALKMNTCMSYIAPRTARFGTNSEGTERLMCFCNGTRLCNGDGTKVFVKKATPYLTCSCSGYPFCSAENTCTDQICTYTTTNQPTKQTTQIKQGCASSTGPGFESLLDGGCLTPGVIESAPPLVDGRMDFDPFLHVETCMCGKEFCNSKYPKRRQAVGPKSRCTMKIATNITGESSGSPSCEGDFCFEMTHASALFKFRYDGCFSYLSDELANTTKNKMKSGCIEIETPNTVVKLCISKNIEH